MKKSLKELKRAEKKKPKVFISTTIYVIFILLTFIWSYYISSYVIKNSWLAGLETFGYLLVCFVIGIIREKTLFTRCDARTKAKVLNDILTREELSLKEQIEYLDKIADEKAQSRRVTKYLFKPITSFFSTILFPLLIIIIPWFLDEVGLSIIAIKPLALIFYIFHSIVRNFLSLKTNKGILG